MVSMQALSDSDELRPMLRGVNEHDWAYIRDSWKKSFRDLGSERHIPAYLYYRNQTAEIDRCAMHAKFRIACDPVKTDFIWGWACVDGPVLHYVFTRDSCRGNGVARMLTHGLPQPLQVTHWTADAEAIAHKHPGALLFQPSKRRR